MKVSLTGALARPLNTYACKRESTIAELAAAEVDAIQTMFAVAAGGLDEQGLAAWIAKNSVKIACGSE